MSCASSSTGRWCGFASTSARPGCRCWWRSARRDGQKVLLGLKNMGGESEAAWRAFLDALAARGLGAPELAIVDGAPGLEAAIAALWPQVLVQRCTVHKHRNLLAHAPKKLHDELSADYTDMIYAKTVKEVDAKRKAFVRKWRLKVPRSSAAWKKPEHGCSPSCATRPSSGSRCEPRISCRAPARGVQAAHQDPVPAALRRDRLHAVLGLARQRSDQPTPRRWLGHVPCPTCRARS